MDYPKYELWANTDLSLFRFLSDGIQGAVEKAVFFRPTANPSVYYLCFGDIVISQGGAMRVDDHAVTNNGDPNKILATVAAAVYKFMAWHPGKFLLFKGSSPSRTRLYRRAISLNFDEISGTFDIFGLVIDSTQTLQQHDFDKDAAVYAFLIKNKQI